VVGVAAGVAALIIALAINAGFREDLQNKLLGAQAHISLLPKDREGIPNYLQVTKQVDEIPGVVVAAPAVFQTVLISSGNQNQGVFLKGIIPEMESKISALSANIVDGTIENFDDDAIIIGKELASAIGTYKGDRIKILSAQTRLTPLGGLPRSRTFEVKALFSSGLYEYDKTWVYVTMAAAQRLRASAMSLRPSRSRWTTCTNRKRSASRSSSGRVEIWILQTGWP
jgi:lipoprotein-releasing system permease protein